MDANTLIQFGLPLLVGVLLLRGWFRKKGFVLPAAAPASEGSIGYTHAAIAKGTELVQKAFQSTSKPPITAEDIGDWINELIEHVTHLIVVGATDSGKTSLLKEIVRRLREEGKDVFVLDPDAAHGDWGNAVVVGAGDDFAAILTGLDYVDSLAKSRREERANGKREFPEFYIVVDEYWDVQLQCANAKVVVERLLRRGSKLNMHLLLGVQDDQVRTLGFEGKSALLQNASKVEALKLADGTRAARIDGSIPVLLPSFREPAANLKSAPEKMVVSRTGMPETTIPADETRLQPTPDLREEPPPADPKLHFPDRASLVKYLADHTTNSVNDIQAWIKGDTTATARLVKEVRGEQASV